MNSLTKYDQDPTYARIMASRIKYYSMKYDPENHLGTHLITPTESVNLKVQEKCRRSILHLFFEDYLLNG